MTSGRLGLWSMSDGLHRTSISDMTYRLERAIRDLVADKDFERIKKIIQQLCNDYAYAVHQPHARNGGLIGLAAAAIALGPVWFIDTSFLRG
jgi:hypothetical protein